jgi:hypothetical protein
MAGEALAADAGAETLSAGQRAVRGLSLAVWALVGLYFGIGGWVDENVQTLKERAVASKGAGSQVDYKGVTYQNAEQLEWDLAAQSAESVFFWLAWPPFLSLAMTALAFGALGATLQTLREILSREAPEVTVERALVLPFFGAIMGALVLGLSYLVPTALIVAEDVRLRMTSIFVLCMLGGLFSEHFYRWIEHWMTGVLRLTRGGRE